MLYPKKTTNDGYEWLYRYAEENGKAAVARSCPLSLVDCEVGTFMQIYNAVKLGSTWPVAGGLYEQPFDVVECVMALDSEIHRIETVKMREKK